MQYDTHTIKKTR